MHRYTTTALLLVTASDMPRIIRLGRTLVYRLPGPMTTRSAWRMASIALGWACADSGAIINRSISPACLVILDSPRTTLPSVKRAESSSPTVVDGTTRPRTARTRLDSSRASSKLPVMSLMAAMNRLPKL